MKKIMTISILVLSVLSCKAQQIVPIYYDGTEYEYNSNYYLKDINNDFDKFIGTWLFDNGTIQFKMILEKEIQVQSQRTGMYKDLLVGEYKYVENGIEKANTLNDINDTTISGFSHNICGYSILDKTGKPPCDTCNINERRVSLGISNPLNPEISATFILRYVNDNGIEKIEANIRSGGDILLIDENSTLPTQLDMAFGNYVFIKQ